MQDVELEKCASKLIELAASSPDVYILRAMLALTEIWKLKADALEVADAAIMQQEVDKLKQILSGSQSASTIEKVLQEYAQSSASSEKIELLDAIQLAGALQIQAAVPQLLHLLEIDSPSCEAVIIALGTAGDASAARPLIAFAHKLFKIDQRIGPSISAVPVVESDNLKSKLYWRILQALGNLPGDNTTKFLFDGANDFAPDKRQQILDSLTALFSTFSKYDVEQFADLVKSGLDDPSAPVRVSSLKGVAVLNAVQHVDKVLKMSDSQEPSVSRQSLATLRQLSQSGNEIVFKAIQEKLSAETDEKRKRRLAEVVKK